MDDALDENARGHDRVGVDLARLDEMLDLGDGVLPALAIIGLNCARFCGRRGCLPCRPSRP